MFALCPTSLFSSNLPTPQPSPPSNAMKRALTSTNSTFLVQGASRGLGLTFVEHFLTHSHPTSRVVATCRNPENVDSNLLRLVEKHGAHRCCVVPLDVEQPNTIEECADQIRGSHGHVDVLLNVAGLLHDGDNMPERKLEQIKQEWVLRSMAVNAVGPLLVAKSFAPMMNGKQSQRGETLLCNMSARVGSIGDNGLGGWTSYRMSKAALNMATKNLSIELKRQKTVVVSMHPGTCDTDLSAPFQRNVTPGKLFEKDFAVTKMTDVLKGLNLDGTGTAYDWAGEIVPW